MAIHYGMVNRSNANGHCCINSVLVHVQTKGQGGAIHPMECTKLQELRKWKLKPTGCESCSLVEGLAILKVKSPKFDVNTLDIVKFTPKLSVGDKDNRAGPHKRGYRQPNGPSERRYKNVFLKAFKGNLCSVAPRTL